MGVTAYILFFLAGLGFGYAAPGRAKLIPFVFPVVMAIFAFLIYGIEGTIVIRVIVALVVMTLGIVLGIALEQRRGGEAATA